MAGKGGNPPRPGRVLANSLENHRPPRLCQLCALPMAQNLDRRTKYHADCRMEWNTEKRRIGRALKAAGLDAGPASVAREMAKTKPSIDNVEVAQLLSTDITEATLTRLRLSPGPQEELQHLLASHGLFTKIVGGETTQRAVAQMLDVHETQVSRAVRALRALAIDTLVKGAYVPPENISELLWRVPVPQTKDHTEIWMWAERAADAFLGFEYRYFRLPGGKRYIRKEFHRRWIVEAMFAIATGGYLQILAPPRHGKSELMVHFCVWLICRDPNVRILWCAASEPLASDFVWAVAQTLDENSLLVGEVCAPGETFAPPKRGPGTTWTKSEFTVVNRDSVLVGATLQAIGANGSILSRNADLLIADDLESIRTVKMPSTRRATRNWFSTVWDTRKEAHTASIVIGSRQHVDDLYGYNLNDANFRTVVDRAHDLACQLPRYNLQAHVDCVLFPERMPYEFLYSKMTGAAARTAHGDEDANMFDLVYQNIARTSTSSFWSEELVVAARDPLRPVGPRGLEVLGEDRYLIAGLDPAASGYQAAVLVALVPKRGEPLPYADAYTNRLRMQDWVMERHIVDYDNRLGGGVEPMLELMDAWLVDYGLRHWVVEDMAMQKAFTVDPRVKFWARVNDGIVEGHTTNDNKYSPDWGLGALIRLWRDGLVTTPYMGDEAQRKTDQFEGQLLTFDGNVESERTRRKDLHMAFWFTNRTARRREKELVAAQSGEAPVPASASYPNITGFSSHNEAPWR